MPILKQLVNNDQSKRRSRTDLTVEMISAPLGDFRHTMHVGRGGDAFGDTSFLSTRSGEPPKEKKDSPNCHIPHAESVMSFHIDLGPSMLGDILSVMEKKSWEDDDLGYEEGKGSEGYASPSHIPHIDDDDAEEQAPSRPPRATYKHNATADPYTPDAGL
uniref:CDC42 effector protein (Rho GTPase binding) 4b n=1 Tax=Nothobranchius furzeri TaxID=105023 RepID=A0A8C6Q8S2_NOTFU